MVQETVEIEPDNGAVTGMYFLDKQESFDSPDYDPTAKPVIEPLILEMRKNQSDSLAGIAYAMGVSLVHFALIFGWFFAKHPDEEKARSLETLSLANPSFLSCGDYAALINSVLNKSLAFHIVCGLSAFSKEVANTL